MQTLTYELPLCTAVVFQILNGLVVRTDYRLWRWVVSLAERRFHLPIRRLNLDGLRKPNGRHKQRTHTKENFCEDVPPTRFSTMPANKLRIQWLNIAKILVKFRYHLRNPRKFHS